MLRARIAVVALGVLVFTPVLARQSRSGQEFELSEATITSLQDAMASGRYTSRRLVELYTARIEAIDHAGPALGSMIEMNPEALAIADTLDAERKAKGARGPLHGIPVVIKDNIDTADRMMTTAGSLALQGSIAPRDAFLVQRLREAGAVILGKTNLSEWANFRSTRSTSGWSGRGGQVRNPYVLDRNPCGSSSGTGTAIAANLAAVGIGTETDGSIVCPSSTVGLVGIKPTVGLVSRSGIIPISHSQDSAGPMARTVSDAAILLDVIAGVDARDKATSASRGRGANYSESLKVDGLKGARIGVARKRFFGYNEPTDRLANAAIAAMKAQGAVIIDPADIPNADRLDACENTVLQFEFKTDLNAYLKGLAPSVAVHSLADLIAFNERERAREMPFFGQEILTQSERRGPLTAEEYEQALATCRYRARTLGIDAVMTKLRLDAIVAPTGGPAWPTDLVNGDHFTGSSSTPAAVAGYPSITVPAGQVFGLPVGISFIGRAWSEPTLIRLAYAYEQATRLRSAPAYRPTLTLETGAKQ